MVIFNWGVWLEFEIDVKNVLYVWIDCMWKILLMELVWVLGYGFDDDIIDMLGEIDSLMLMLEKDVYKNIDDFWVEEFLKDIYEWLCFGEFKMVDSLWSLLIVWFFDLKWYDFVLVGCYKVNKKLSMKMCLMD